MATMKDPNGRPKISDILTSPIIKVKIGNSDQEFLVHKALLVRYSGFFRGALGSDTFKEAADGVVTLSDVEPITFEIFADYLLTGRVASTDEWEEAYPETISQTSRMTRCYIFADRFLAPEFGAFVFAEAVQKFKKSPGISPWYSDVAVAFDNLPSNSPFLQLLVDSQTERWRGAELDKYEKEADIDNLPSAFLYRVLARMKELDPSKKLAIRSAREYIKKVDSEETTDTGNGEKKNQ